MHRVAIVALPDTVALDLSIPVGVFGSVRLASGEPGYSVNVCSTDTVVRAGPFNISTDSSLDLLAEADTIVVPGRSDIRTPPAPALVAALRAAYASGTRIATICSGTFTLAETGLLDGRRATTHWVVADAFRAAFPNVQLDEDVLYVDEGQVLTSAGSSAGIDLCLYMVANDYGTTVASNAARLNVVPLHRSGGQAQFIVRSPDFRESIGQRNDLDNVLAWIEQEAHRNLTLDDIADHAAVSSRTLNRRFQKETGQTPMQWLTSVRVRHAQQLLESTNLGVEAVGRRVGFTSPTNFRSQFRRLTGASPRDYRETYRDRLAA